MSSLQPHTDCLSFQVSANALPGIVDCKLVTPVYLEQQSDRSHFINVTRNSSHLSISVSETLPSDLSDWTQVTQWHRTIDLVGWSGEKHLSVAHFLFGPGPWGNMGGWTHILTDDSAVTLSPGMSSQSQGIMYSEVSVQMMAGRKQKGQRTSMKKIR